MPSTKLSVNINKIATIRNARGGTIPSVSKAATACEQFGADGITVHPRPDQRHITYNDVREIEPLLTTEFNIEGYPNRNWLDLVLETKPQQATLVPDKPGVLTSNAGWNTTKEKDLLLPIVQELQAKGIRVSIFINAEVKMAEGAAKLGADRIELYTGPYAEQFFANEQNAVKHFVETAKAAHEFGLGVNAGHDLDLQNLRFFAQNVPHLAEVSIGHALISDALYYGLENTVQLYKRCLS